MSRNRVALVLFVAVLGTALVLAAPADAGPKYGGKRVSAKEQALIELGRRLFFDPLVSRSGERSCASCHDPEYGFSDPMIVSEDDVGNTVRHSQTIIDSHLNPTAHWDGEFSSIEALVTARIGLPRGTKSLGHGAPLTFQGSGAGGPTAGQHGPGDPAVTVTPSLADGPPPPNLPSSIRNPGSTAGRTGNGRSGGGYGPPPTAPPPPPPSSSTPRPTLPPAREPNDPVPVDDDNDDPGSDDPGSDDPGSDDPANEKGDEEDIPPPDVDNPRPTDEAEDGESEDAAEAEEEQEEVKADVTPSFDVLDLAKLPRVQDVLEDGQRYDEAFKYAFGSTSVTTARISQAIAAYCRSLASTEAPYDRFAKGDKTAISVEAQRGLALFKGRAGCAKCHTLKGKHAPLTDFEFHNTGIAWHDLPEERRASVRESQLRLMLDQGRERISRRGGDRRAFKTATLRDLTRRGPYMHTGVFETLHEVVRHYAAGGTDDPEQDKRITGFEASEQDIVDLVAFLESLTGDERPGLAPEAWHVRPERTRLRLVDSAGRPLANMSVTLHPVGDVLPGNTARTDRAIECQSDEKGWIEYTPARRTHVRVELPDGLELSHGDVVPDTCEKAELSVPVKGKAVLMLSRNADRPLPKVLVAEHPGTIVLPGHSVPRSMFVRGEVIETGGVVTARYEAWFRTDLPNEVLLRLPSERGLTEQDLTLKLKSGKVATLDLSH